MTGSVPEAAATATILVVDDDPEVRALLLDVLVEDGYAVRSAVDGAAALRCVVEHAPDVVLLDVAMPRLRGVETLVALRELAPETKVIMISGQTDEDEARRALRLGALDYIAKPFDLAYLHQVLAVAVGLIEERPGFAGA